MPYILIALFPQQRKPGPEHQKAEENPARSSAIALLPGYGFAGALTRR
jgi:hypothetical protein